MKHFKILKNSWRKGGEYWSVDIEFKVYKEDYHKELQSLSGMYREVSVISDKEGYDAMMEEISKDITKLIGTDSSPYYTKGLLFQNSILYYHKENDIFEFKETFENNPVVRGCKTLIAKIYKEKDYEEVSLLNFISTLKALGEFW